MQTVHVEGTVFMQLGNYEEELPGLKYRGIPLWDSIGHMDLVGELEEAFDIHMDTPDVLDFTSYEKGKEVLGRYGVTIE